MNSKKKMRVENNKILANVCRTLNDANFLNKNVTTRNAGSWTHFEQKWLGWVIGSRLKRDDYLLAGGGGGVALFTEQVLNECKDISVNRSSLQTEMV